MEFAVITILAFSGRLNAKVEDQRNQRGEI